MKKFLRNTILVAVLSFAIVGVYAPNSTYATNAGWQQDSVGWWYKNADGSYPVSKWMHIDGKWYYFNNRGYIIHSKWEMINNAWYYFNTSGHMLENKWELINNEWYYFDTSGRMLSNQWVGDYYLGGNGAMLKSAITPGGYVVGKDGKWVSEISNLIFQDAKYKFDSNYGYSRIKAIKEVASQRGISEHKAALAVDAVNPNYIEQAKKAIYRSYILSYGTYSNKTILNRLVNDDQFTTEEAVAALKSINMTDTELAKLTISKLYLSDSFRERGHFSSKISLIDKMKLWGFSVVDIENAISELNVDFTNEAKLAAKYQLDKSDHKITKAYLEYILRDTKFTNQEIHDAINNIQHSNLLD